MLMKWALKLALGGYVKSPSDKLVAGIGINDGSISATVNGVRRKEYALWKSMIERVYLPFMLNRGPSYEGCSVSDNFKYYHKFYQWCQEQIGFNEEGFALDKDLLLNGNKVYSEDTCVFIPHELNSLILCNNIRRGDCLVGVRNRNGRYIAECRVFGIKKHIGSFDTPELAFEAYRLVKETHIKELANLYKDIIDPRAYNALLNYSIDIGD